MSPQSYRHHAGPAVRFIPPAPGPYAVPQPMPGYGPWPPAPPKRSGLAAASLVCGLVGLFTLGIAALPAIVLGYMARGEARRQGQPGDPTATAGIVLGWIVLVVGVLLMVLMVMWVGSAATRHG